MDNMGVHSLPEDKASAFINVVPDKPVIGKKKIIESIVHFYQKFILKSKCMEM
ncbi:hypothetical protein A8990_11970 [Paenibacillus taihuensis]|uniref:Uncharacterized protein n=1 Tax=Paenibacillus taihuensis TaxID=1156355 RepID=A0A3D9RVX9_9BACL|nr:hypothetical protein [Paenibacillus taihuensis]REE81236.1 hypothetical protein A8990_11970 [Paenibacillus taihuensis]